MTAVRDTTPLRRIRTSRMRMLAAPLVLALALLSAAPQQILGQSTINWAAVATQLRSDATAMRFTLPPSWQTGVPCDCASVPEGHQCQDQWAGVDCGDSQEGIVGLTLANMHANGTLPSSWGASLANLTKIAMDGNSIQGPLPQAWSTLTRLSYLSLAGNSLTSSLPSSWSDLDNLEYLDLTGNDLEGSLPDEWGDMIALGTLDLANNNFAGQLPDSWTFIRDLEHLDISGNTLSSTLPSAWSGFTSLTALVLTGCGLTSTLPPSWSFMTSLQELDLSSNSLQGTLPEEWSGMKALSSLHLQYNMLWGPVPDSWRNTSLSTIRLGGNKALCGPLPTWMTTEKPDHFLASTPGTGLGSPCWFQVLQDVRSKYFENTNIFNGVDPATCICDEQSDPPCAGGIVCVDNLLVEMDLNEAALPNLPAEFSQLTDLTALYLGINEANTTLPNEWSALINLRALSAQAQRIQGTLPKQWSAMKSLTDLNLMGNLITGTIPATWSAMVHLDAVTLSMNRLTGNLPGHFAPNVTDIILTQNQLGGPLPQMWSSLTRLTNLELHNNKFVGTLPASWSTLKDLQTMWLGNNLLSGPIPASWTAMSSLNYLRLPSNSRLCGAYPPGFGPPEWAVVPETKTPPNNQKVLIVDFTALGEDCSTLGGLGGAPESNSNSSSNSNSDGGAQGGGLSGGAIAGIVIGVLAAVGLIGWFAYTLTKRMHQQPGHAHRLPLSSGLPMSHSGELPGSPAGPQTGIGLGGISVINRGLGSKTGKKEDVELVSF